MARNEIIASLALVATLIVLAGCAGSTPRPSSTEGASETTSIPTTVDLTIRREAQTPWLLEGSVTSRLDMTVTHNESGQSQPAQTTIERDFTYLDQFQLVAPGEWKCSRTMLKDWSTTDGDADDSELHGKKLRASFQEPDGYELKLSHGVARESTLQQALMQIDAFGFWVDLPSSSSIGDTVSPDLRPLISTVMPFQGEYQTGEFPLVLESVDPATGLATLRGEVRFSRTELFSNVEAKVEGNGAASLVVDTKMAKLRSCAFELTVEASGSDGTLTLAGTGTVSAKMVGRPTTEGGTPEPTPMRTNVFAVRKHGVQVELPSHYFDSEAEGPWTTLVRSVDGTTDQTFGSAIYISRQTATQETAADLRAVLENAYEQQGVEAEFDIVTCPLGEGVHVSWVDNEGAAITKELYPFAPGMWLVYQIELRQPAGKEDALREYDTARATLRRLGQ